MKTNAFMIISMLLGVVSIMTCPLFFISIPAGAIGIILALLSKGKEMQMEIMPKAGVVTCGIGMTLSVLITIAMVGLMLFSPGYRKQLNETSQAVYGVTFDELMESSYGYSLEDLQERASSLMR